MGERFFSEEGPSKMKMAVIAGASEALKARAKNIGKSDDEVLRIVTGKMDEILGNID